MLKKILLAFAITFFVLGVIYLTTMVDYQLDQQYNGPAWIYIIPSLIAFVLFFEILTRIVPKRFETPISLFRKYDVQDQRVAGVSILVFLVLIVLFSSLWQLQMQLEMVTLRTMRTATTTSITNFKWISYLGIATCFFIPWLILFWFGSEKIKNGVSTESFRNATPRDKVVRLFAPLAQLIIMTYPIGMTSDYLLLFACIWIAPFIKIPIFLIFGSQELRESVIPQWIKKVINKSQ